MIVEKYKDLFHVCLAGRSVSDDWDMIRTFRSAFVVTLADRIETLLQRDFLSDVDLLVLDCTGNAEFAMKLVPRLSSGYPELLILLVDGGLSQKDIASAFSAGIREYFAAPYDIELLVERAESLCARLKPRNRPVSTP